MARPFPGKHQFEIDEERERGEALVFIQGSIRKEGGQHVLRVRERVYPLAPEIAENLRSLKLTGPADVWNPFLEIYGVHKGVTPLGDRDDVAEALKDTAEYFSGRMPQPERRQYSCYGPASWGY